LFHRFSEKFGGWTTPDQVVILEQMF
jgi:hypothetical protein